VIEADLPFVTVRFRRSSCVEPVAEGGTPLWSPSKFAFFGGLLSKEYTEEDNWYWHYLARRDFGGVVYRPNRLRRIIDTNTPATFGAGGTWTAVPAGGPTSPEG
jgi:hypothetical protein